MRTALATVERWIVHTEDRLANTWFREYGTRIAFLAYTFVFFYYGLLKVIPGFSTPVKGEVNAFMHGLGVPELAAVVGLTYTVVPVMYAIGVYEVTLGLLFAFRKIRAAFVLFFTHQLTTLVSLVVATEAYFQEPFLFGTVPWLFDTFAAYVLKNVIFIGGFVVLAGLELGEEPPRRATGGGHSETTDTRASSGTAD